SCRNEWNTGHEEIEAKQRNFYEQLIAEQEAKISEYHENAREKIAEIEEQVKSCRNEWNAGREEIEAKQRNFYEQLEVEQEAKISEYHENARGKIAEIEKLVKTCINEWDAGREEMETKQRNLHEQFAVEQEKLRANWQRDVETQDALALSQRKLWEAAVAEAEDRLARLEGEVNVKITRAEESLLMELDRRLDAYREGEAVQWKRLETAADDALKLDNQLRLVMEEAETRVRRDFSHFEEEQKVERERIGSALSESAEGYKAQLAALEQELNTLKNRAYDNVSEKLKVFEDDFFADLARRSTEVDRRLAEWNSNLEQKLVSLAEEGETERRSLELSFKESLSARMEEQKERILSELERLKLKADAFEEKIQNGLDETENRVSGLSGSLEAVGRGLKEFTAQTRLFEKTDELKLDLERSMETLRAELSGVEDRRAEAARLETEFIKVRRLEDEVNTKMTRFLTEKNHLDIIEKDFDRLIQTSLRVEERLKEVTGADDTLQNLQVSLRKLEDAIAAAEDKYQRVESKNRILEETNRGIERNFQILEETELALRKCRENIDRTEEDLDSFRPSIEELAAASEKAREAEEKLITLDTGLSAIEARIEKMQVAREWLARAETRFEELNREAQEELKLLEAVLKDESKKSGSSGKGSPPPSTRENVKRLARQGWGAEEIARSLKISRGEVEMILEMPGLR
ncbi:MAG: hypothetical protein LBB72_07665, partial [Spirochaetaceae bacterium]|nr:hypothetical protein [Spirochaetaceae bacterium]